MSDTIFAVASGAGKAGVAIIRLSGPYCASAVQLLVSRLPVPRLASLRAIRDPSDGATIDHGIVLWFPKPNSFTGEDCAEFHLHGGRAIVAAVLARLSEITGLRSAYPGEFTRRAFINGRIDLAQAEGLSDLIDSETELQRRQAMLQFERGLGREVDRWRSALVSAQALIEAQIDFSDEGDVPREVFWTVAQLIAPVGDDLRRALAESRMGEIVREGVRIVIAGPPNAGKSSLLNHLSKRNVAIVSDRPGTTRDVLEVRLELGGAPVVLLDSAGLRNSEDAVELEGMDRARREIGGADIVLWLAEVGTEFEAIPTQQAGQTVIRVATKGDLMRKTPQGAEHVISTKDSSGVARMVEALGEQLITYVRPTGAAVLTRERHRLACHRALTALERINVAGVNAPLELVAEDLRVAGQALASLIGEVDVEDVLDEIFSRFCIGK